MHPAPTLDCYVHDETAAFRFEIDGCLCGPCATQVEQSWRTASSVIGNRPVVVSMGNVSRIDSCGRALLRRWHDAGVRFFGKSPLAKTLIGAIVGKSLLSIPAETQNSSSNASHPFQWVRAWEQAVDIATLRMDERLTLRKPFLWSEVTPERIAALRSGEILTSHLRSGRIHDWIAAVFIEGASLNDVLRVGRRRPDQGPECCTVQIDDVHAYIVTRFERLQRIGEARIATSRLYTLTRIAERQTGVYVEMEAIGLRAEMPGPLRWLTKLMASFRPITSLDGSLRDIERALYRGAGAGAGASA